jgi:fibrillarin-like rRNA methylase
MKGYFTKPGKYKSYVKIVNVSEEDVISQKIYDIYDKNAQSFNRAGKFVYEGQKAIEEPKKDEDKYKDITKKELVEKLKEKGIEADEKMKKDELIKIFEE